MSLRKAINEHCKWCIYDPANGGTWRQQVENCPCSWCALYEVRPISKPNSRNPDGKNKKAGDGQAKESAPENGQNGPMQQHSGLQTKPSDPPQPR